MFRASYLQRLAILTVLLVASVPPALPQRRPLQSQPPSTITPGNVLLEFGFDFLQNVKYPLSGLRGDQTSLGVIGINIGLGEVVEFQIQGTAHHFLSINQVVSAPVEPILNSAGTATRDFGDLLFSTKMLLIPEGKRRPAIAFRPSVQLPNASTARGLGLNSTQFFGTMLVGKHFGKLNLFGNVGLGILANPVQAGVQNDVLVYGIAGIYPLSEKVSLAAEIFGRQNTRGESAPVGTESLSQLRLGLQISSGGFRWDLAGIAGLTEKSPHSGITFGVSKEFPALRIPSPSSKR
ncbi:MAG: hypothetical protein AB1898_20520 [Acidobacteriota bacterium]